LSVVDDSLYRTAVQAYWRPGDTQEHHSNSTPTIFLRLLYIISSLTFSQTYIQIHVIAKQKH